MMLKKIINSFALIFETAKKEKELIFKDSAVIEIYILFVTLVYFFYTFVYSPEIFTNLPVAYVDNDQTTISHQIRRMINETESLEIAYDATSLEEAKKLFEEGKVNGVILIPKDFSRQLQLSGGNASIAVYSDASYMLYYDKTLQAVTNALGAFTGELQLKQTMMSGEPMKQAVASSKPFNIIANPLYNLEEGYAIFLIPVVLIIALQTLQLTGMGVLYGTMRENDTFVTNFAMAKRRFGYFFMTIGRALPYLVISMLLLLLGILVVFHIFTIPQRGNLFEIIIFLIPVVLSITFLGQALMNIFRNREDTIMLLTVFSIPALMMGGVSYPIVAFPLWIKVMGFFFPSTVGVKGFLSLSQAGASLIEIKEIFMQMWLICSFYFVLAVWTNRRFMYGLVPSKIVAKSEEFDKELEEELKQKNSDNEIDSLEEKNSNNSILAIAENSEDEIKNSIETSESKLKEINSELTENVSNDKVEIESDLTENVSDDKVEIESDLTENISDDKVEIESDLAENVSNDKVEIESDLTENVSDNKVEIESDLVENISDDKVEIESDLTENISDDKVEIESDLAENVSNDKVEIESDLAENVADDKIYLLNPLKKIITNFDETTLRISDLLNDKLEQVKSDNLQTPAAYIAAPILENLKFVTDSKELSNLYLNLLANAMDKNSIGMVHPSFVDTIKYLTPDEVNILNVFLENNKIPFVDIIQIKDENSGNSEMILEKHNHIIEDYKIEISHPDNLNLYLENLIRIGILSIENSSLSNANYKHLENCELNRYLRKNIENQGYKFKSKHGFYKTTAFGNGFIQAVIKDK